MTGGTGHFLKKQRLNGPSAFRNVFNANQRSIDSQFLVLARRNHLEYSRLGLAVSRKKLRSAVTRNKVKRLIRESFRKHQETLVSLDLVVVPQGSIDAANTRQLRESLNSHWRNLSKCKDS